LHLEFLTIRSNISHFFFLEEKWWWFIQKCCLWLCIFD